MHRLGDWLKSIRVRGRYKEILFVYCIAVAAFDTWIQNLTIISASALALAVLPWIVDAVEKISVPGGFELVLNRAEQRIQELPVPAPEARPPQRHVFLDVYEDDPQLALAGLRIEIEKRLRRLADQHGIATGGRTINALLREVAPLV